MPAIRPYRAEDRAACRHVFFRAVRIGAATLYTPAQCAAWAPDPVPGSGGPDKLMSQWCFVAEEEGEIIGFMSMTPQGHLDMAFVMPEVMGKGVAAALFDRLIAEARTKGVAHLTVHASHLARRFFGRRGWQVDAPEVVEIGDQRLTRFAMSLTLAPDGASPLQGG